MRLKQRADLLFSLIYLLNQGIIQTV